MQHEHTYPECSTDFTCEVPFCVNFRPMMCDTCVDETTKIVPHAEGYQQVVDYLRERVTVGQS